MTWGEFRERTADHPDSEEIRVWAGNALSVPGVGLHQARVAAVAGDETAKYGPGVVEGDVVVIFKPAVGEP